MGSIYTDKHGPVYQFTGPDNKRRKLRLTDLVRDGKKRTVKSSKEADKIIGSFVDGLERLITTVKFGRPLSDSLAAWIKESVEPNAKLAAKFVEYGLLVKAAEPVTTTLGPFLDAYKQLRGDVKASTAIVYSHTIRNLKDYFGEGRELSTINVGDAKEFRLKLMAPKPEGEGLAKNTARRRCTLAKQFFTAAVDKEIITKNPFQKLSESVKGNDERDYFLTREDAAKILEACPNNRWKLIFALSRFGGLRTPSEHTALRWDGVDLPGDRFLVHSPKTEHHEGGASRWVPIFPELRKLFEIAAIEAGDDEFVISRRNGKLNVRTQFEKIIKRAGLLPWPKLFQNLRSTRETELCNEGWPIQDVCAWLGHSPTVAMKHYLQTSDANFKAAATAPITGAILAQSGVVRSVLGCSATGDASTVNSVEHVGTSENTFSHVLKVGGEGLEPATSTV